MLFDFDIWLSSDEIDWLIIPRCYLLNYSSTKLSWKRWLRGAWKMKLMKLLILSRVMLKCNQLCAFWSDCRGIKRNLTVIPKLKLWTNLGFLIVMENIYKKGMYTKRIRKFIVHSDNFTMRRALKWPEFKYLNIYLVFLFARVLIA